MNTCFPIGTCTAGLPGHPLIVAEIACAHHGSEERAMRLIDAAAQTGADIIQLQIFRAADQVPTHHKLRALLETLEFSDATWERLFRHAHGTGRTVSAFVYDEASLALATQFAPAHYKLNSSDLGHVRLLEQVGATGIPVSLGVGASSLEEILHALRVLEKQSAGEIILLHGVQSFPTPPAEARLQRLSLLRQTFHRPVGYADHTSGDHPHAWMLDLVALGCGVVLLEKHLTLSRAEQLTDYQAALEPDAFREYVVMIREAASALKDGLPLELTAQDHTYRQFQKKYAFTRRAFQAGEKIQRADVMFLRAESGVGFSEDAFASVSAWSVARDLPAEHLLTSACIRPVRQGE